MKKIIFLAVVLLLVSDLAYSQVVKPRKQRMENRIEKLEQMKLIESLVLDEETTLKFFARRSEHQNEMKTLQQKASDKLLQIEELMNKNVSEQELQKKIAEYSLIENNIHNERSKFISTLNDILTAEQIAKLLIFEKKFKQEIKDVIIRERQRRKN